LARHALRLLADQTEGPKARLVESLVQLAQASDDKAAARHALLGLLADQTEGQLAAALVGGLIQLGRQGVNGPGNRAMVARSGRGRLAITR
jgi:hypothetical protein